MVVPVVAASTRRISGLQRQVLSLYRRAVRAARAKDAAAAREEGAGQVAQGSWQVYARSQFEQHRGLQFKDHMMIEYHIRRGVKAVDLLSKPEVQSLQQR